MNHFEYYANDVVLESANLDQIKALKKEFNEKYSYQDFCDTFDEYMEEGNFSAAEKHVTQYEKMAKEYYAKISALPTTAFDNFKENIKSTAIPMGAALIPTFFGGMWNAAKTFFGGKEVKKAIKHTAITYAVFSFAFLLTTQAAEASSLKITDVENTKNYTKNDALIEIKTVINSLENMKKAIKKTQDYYNQAKKEYPKATKKELLSHVTARLDEENRKMNEMDD